MDFVQIYFAWKIIGIIFVIIMFVGALLAIFIPELIRKIKNRSRRK